MTFLHFAFITLLACTVAMARSLPNEDAPFDFNHFLVNPELYDKRSRGEADLDIKFDDSLAAHSKTKASNDRPLPAASHPKARDKSSKEEEVFELEIVSKATPVVTKQCKFLFLVTAAVFGACIVIYLVAEATKPERQTRLFRI